MVVPVGPRTLTGVVLGEAAGADRAFTIKPVDAAVYIDGKFVGSAEDFGADREPLLLQHGVGDMTVLSDAAFGDVHAGQRANGATGRGDLQREAALEVFAVHDHGDRLRAHVCCPFPRARR